MALNSKQRAYLRRLGQDEAPILMVGKAGVTPSLRVQLEDALQARELVKGRVLPNAPSEPGEIAAYLASDSKSDLVGLAGRNFLLFRRSEKKPRIELPL